MFQATVSLVAIAVLELVAAAWTMTVFGAVLMRNADLSARTTS